MMDKKLGEVKNSRIVKGKKVFNCVQCGACCHIREREKLSPEDEEKYKNYMFSRFGIIYLANLSDITINAWPEEAETLKKEAERRKIDIKILPKRAIYDSKNNELIILDYFIDHDICPFFDKTNKRCTIYTLRPLICHSYPLLTTKSLGKCTYKLDDINAYSEEKSAAKKLEQMINLQKQVIKGMIDDNSISIPKTINAEEFANIIKTARFKELRIMEKT